MSNDSEAVRLLKISADQGNAEAQTDLAMLYSFGERGLPQDHREAERLYRLAARQGHDGARRWLESEAPRLGIAKSLYIRGGIGEQLRSWALRRIFPSH
jgi:TPR repeat protein